MSTTLVQGVSPQRDTSEDSLEVGAAEVNAANAVVARRKIVRKEGIAEQVEVRVTGLERVRDARSRYRKYLIFPPLL